MTRIDLAPASRPVAPGSWREHRDSTWLGDVDSGRVCWSLIIVTKARPASLRHALDSSTRALPLDAELIVVDGDPERSAESIVNEQRVLHPHLDMRYLTSEAGTSLQRNAGIDAARGEVVVFIDDDCTFEPRLFEALMRAYDDTSVVGATGHVEYVAGTRPGSNPNSRLRWLVLGGGRQGSVSSFGFRRPIVDVLRPRDVEFMPGPLMSARRDAAAQVRFDERLGTYSLGEDDDFSYRLSRRGRIRYEPSAVVQHHELGWRNMDKRQTDWLRVVNRAYLFRKNFPQTLRARTSFAGLLLLLCAHRVLNRDWAGLRGLFDGISHVCRAGALAPQGPGAPPVARVRRRLADHAIERSTP
jgi:GT2 family glycosyltransferase